MALYVRQLIKLIFLFDCTEGIKRDVVPSECCFSVNASIKMLFFDICNYRSKGRSLGDAISLFVLLLINNHKNKQLQISSLLVFSKSGRKNTN